MNKLSEIFYLYHPLCDVQFDQIKFRGICDGLILNTNKIDKKMELKPEVSIVEKFSIA